MYEPADKNYYKPIDKKTNYVKRAVGIAGDTLEIIDGYVYINGEKNNLPDRAKLQFSYLVETKNASNFNPNVMVNNYDITDQFGKINNTTYQFMGISELSLDKLRNNPNVKSIKKAYALNGGVLENDSLVKGSRDFSVFPQNNNFNWNNDFFGPIYIPKENSTIQINKKNIPIYKRVIDVYENNDLKIKGDKIFINGIETDKYTFKQDYYWMMGDNRGNSQDSRSWGFVPFDHVVGKPIFTWLSIDYNKKGLNKIRWDRMFTTIHGEGKPISFLFYFIGLIVLWKVISFIIKRRKKA